LTSSDNIDVFFTNPNQIDLFVPDGTVAAYEAAAGWTGLKSYSISIVGFTATNGIEYTASGSEVSATGYTGNDTAIEIPNTVSNSGYTYTVTSIGNNAFRDNQLTSVEIPESVTKILYGAFKDNQLTSVTIHNTVTEIGSYAFDGNQLTSIAIPDNVTSIGRYTFRDNQLTNVTIPNSVTSIGEGAFLSNPLTSITVLAITPPTLDNVDNIDVFFTNPNQIDLIVPIGTSAAYEAAVGWTGLKSYSISIVDDNALNFDGQSYVTLDAFDKPDNVTAEFWIKPEQDVAGRTHIFSWGDSVAGGNEIVLNNNDNNTSLAYASWDTNTGAGYTTVGTNLSYDEWYHVAVVVTRTNVSIYINGSLEVQGISHNHDNYDTVRLGDWVAGQHSPKATLDEFRLWSDVRTETEIINNRVRKLTNDDLADTSGAYDNLLIYYPFDQGVANGDNTLITTLIDYSGNGHNGTLTNFTLTGETSNFVSGVDPSDNQYANFITTWTVTDDTGLDIFIPVNSDYTYNYTVDWGEDKDNDGINEISVNQTGEASHIYDAAGTYTVTISGDFPAIIFNDPDLSESNPKKIRTVEQWGFIEWESMANAFGGCENMDVVASDTPDLSDVEIMWGAFRGSGVTGQNTDFNSWNVSNVKAFSLMFEYSNFDANIGSWDFSSVDFTLFNQYIFGREDGTRLADLAPMSCYNTTLTLIGWASNSNTPNASAPHSIAVDNYFEYANTAVAILANKGWNIITRTTDACSSDEYFITTWTVTDDTGLDITIPTTGSGYNYVVDWGEDSDNDGINEIENVTGSANHTYDAAGTYSVTIFGDFPRIYFNNGGDKDKITEVTQWGSIQWQSMANAFEGCTNLNVTAIDSPILDDVTTMQYMFADATSLNADLSNWDVSNVEAMFSLFNGATTFNGDLSWNVSNVTNMGHMFYQASAFNQDINSWDVSSVQYLDNMFNGASAFNQNLSGWSLNSVANISGMFTGSDMDCNNYTDILIAWGNNVDTASGSLTLDVGNYNDSAATAVSNLEAKGWTINGTEVTEECLPDSKAAFITTWTVTADDLDITIPTNNSIYIYNYTIDWGDNELLDYRVNENATHTYRNEGTYTVTITGDFPAIYFNDPFGNNATNSEKIQTVQQWGSSIQWLSMWNAFAGCTNLDVYATDAPNLTEVTEIWGMFRNASSFTGQNTDLNSWDVSNVEKFSTLFTNSQFNADISNWNLQNADVSGGDFSDIFTNTNLDCSNYSTILIGWGNNTNTASGNFTLSGNNFYTDSAATAVSNLEAKGWTINGTEVTECPSLSINDEVFSNTLRVSPNPVTSLLTINGPAGFELKSASVYSIMGKQVLSTTSTNIDTNNLPSGLYILKIENTEGLIATKKIVKQ
ncbi:MAG: BspA family leucine-rich repeat surface protein, partial [Algibacter sp.]